jgi:rod shape determining protein RodA
VLAVRPGTQKRRFIDPNWLVLIVIVAIISIGLLNLRNADFYSEDSFHERQLKWYLLGMVITVLVSVIDLHLISRFAYVAFGIGCLLLVAVLFTEPINNSRRWITIPILNERLQPSEFVKIATVLAIARWYHDQRGQRAKESVNKWIAWLKPWTPHLMLLIPVILIFMEPDLGTALIVTMIGMSMVFFEGVRWRTLVTAAGVVALVFPMAWKFALHDYQKARVLVWWDSEALEVEVNELKKEVRTDESVAPKLAKLQRILDKAYQPRQAVVAIGSGDFWGKGGQQGHANRQRSLPYLHTDFVIATWGEERGFVGCTLLLTLYYLLTYWAIRVTRQGRDKFQVLVAVGVCATIFWQFFVNVGMVTGLLPVVGVALPLLSYGGSSVLSICLGLGLLFNIVLRQRATG